MALNFKRDPLLHEAEDPGAEITHNETNDPTNLSRPTPSSTKPRPPSPQKTATKTTMRRDIRQPQHPAHPADDPRPNHATTLVPNHDAPGKHTRHHTTTHDSAHIRPPTHAATNSTSTHATHDAGGRAPAHAPASRTTQHIAARCTGGCAATHASARTSSTHQRRGLARTTDSTTFVTSEFVTRSYDGHKNNYKPRQHIT